MSLGRAIDSIRTSGEEAEEMVPHMLREHAAILKGMRLMGMSRAGYTLPSSDWFPLYLDVLREYMNNRLGATQSGERWMRIPHSLQYGERIGLDVRKSSSQTQ